MKFADLPHAKAALAIFPSREGFGWVVFDGPLSPYRWKVSSAARKEGPSAEKNDRCLKAVEKLLREFRPGCLVLESFDGKESRRHPRIRALCRGLIALAATEGLTVRIITRAEIEKIFGSAPAETREKVAEVVSRYVREYGWRLPDKRKIWESDEPVMALFAATALLVVHYANPAEPL
jgi:hypothetical protein